MFTEERKTCSFQWSDLGDPCEGRPNLGDSAPVLVYRLMQYAIRDVLISQVGVASANETFYLAGKLAGEQFSENLLDCKLEFNNFIAQLQQVLKQQKIGILRVEDADLDLMRITLTVEEDLDCSGLSPTDEVVCIYDEGFIAGILYAYTGKEFEVKEVDCWGTGERTCRFEIQLNELQ